VVQACKHSNLNVDVQLLLQTKLFNLVLQIQRGGQTGPNLYCCYPAYLRIQNRFYHFLPTTEQGIIYDIWAILDPRRQIRVPQSFQNKSCLYSFKVLEF